ncbi:MAG: ABC transporter substrate-binding protein/permease, partial [Deltaproteobacteria bacterium]|nr:ABC transporter substrate-binding protein/permease [Deltaproteobacteria bacterium]
LATLNQIIAQLKADGTLADMKRRWFEHVSGPYEELSITLPKKGQVLRVGMSGTEEPFGFVDKNGRLTGHDGELSRILAARLHRPVEFVTMKFMALIPALEAGKIDLIVSDMTATAERWKAVDFTQPYFVDSQVMLVKNKSDDTIASLPFVGSVINSFRINILHENRYLLILDGLKTTVIISIVATIMGTLLGGLVCYMRMSKKFALRLPAKIYISIMRGTPVLVLLMLIFYVVFASVDINPIIVSIIAFGLNFAAYAAEIFRTGIDGVDKGQSEAGIAMGFSKVKTFIYIVLPQTIRRILPVYKGEFITLVKMTSIVGYVAVQDLTKASDIIRSRTFDAFFPLVMIAILYFLISWVLLQSLEYVERITDPKYKRARVRNV